jgi:uncharacterized protein
MSETGLMLKNNPYGSAVAHSAYSAWNEGKLTRVKNRARKLAPLAETVHDKFRAHVLNPDFSCVGAKAAINGNCYRFGFYAEMNSPATTAGLAHDLWEFVQEQPGFGTDYATFVACFASPVAPDEKIWESQLWAQLQNLHEQDGDGWDQSVSSDAESPDFSFSFAETAFFVVGLHPASSRLARRFAYPTLVFNAHAQFERLREQKKFERMKETIRARDLKLQGSLNPNLSNFGELSEARQYSGRAVEENWKCPFRALFER